jgi:16S rRNA A1518/A1519 N6-dimethyltransferase RsmA/KsgA/DIM1 with predicted DNA glycosylase/AP lyase activity
MSNFVIPEASSKGLEYFLQAHDLEMREGRFSRYDEEIYQTVLERVCYEDIVIDISSGDLHLTLRIAQRVYRVYAVEVNPLVVGTALLHTGLSLPRNLRIVCANALDFPLPPDVTTAILSI